MSQTTHGDGPSHRTPAPSYRSRSTFARRNAPQRGGRRRSGKARISESHLPRNRQLPCYAPASSAVLAPEAPPAELDTLDGSEADTVMQRLQAATATQTAIPSWQEAIEMWLRWNTAHEKVTSSIFRDGHDRQHVEDLLDQVEQLRRQAVAMSEKLLGL